ncbi:MAG: hypothetical protein JNL63_05365 [Bacteroidia bacterium]|nr:hypothetical protein [Bacteroidia bacterium]
MIEYEINSSPFFAANKIYCESLEKKFNEMKFDYSGFCNSYGYEVKTSFKRDNLTYDVKCIKHQTTENGVVIPVDANDYFGEEITIAGFNKELDKALIKQGLGNKNASFNLSHGKLYLKIHEAIPDPVDFILSFVKKIR